MLNVNLGFRNLFKGLVSYFTIYALSYIFKYIDYKIGFPCIQYGVCIYIIYCIVNYLWRGGSECCRTNTGDKRGCSSSACEESDHDSDIEYNLETDNLIIYSDELHNYTRSRPRRKNIRKPSRISYLGLRNNVHNRQRHSSI